jgi:hypothetical protein
VRRAVALLALLTSARAAAADEIVETRPLRLAEKGRRLVTSGAFTDVVDREILAQMSSGFATTILLRAYTYDLAGQRTVAFAAATYRIVYDLWDEVYLVRIHDGRGERTSRYGSLAEALKRATTFEDLPVAPLAGVRVGRHHQIGVIVEVNPVSQELMAEVRRWLARPQGKSEVAGNSSFFGSFVSIFVNPKLEEAERTLKFRSQTFYRTGR